MYLTSDYVVHFLEKYPEMRLITYLDNDWKGEQNKFKLFINMYLRRNSKIKQTIIFET